MRVRPCSVRCGSFPAIYTYLPTYAGQVALLLYGVGDEVLKGVEKLRGNDTDGTAELSCETSAESNPRPNLHGRAVSWACRACLQPSLAPTLS